MPAPRARRLTPPLASLGPRSASLGGPQAAARSATRGRAALLRKARRAGPAGPFAPRSRFALGTLRSLGPGPPSCGGCFAAAFFQPPPRPATLGGERTRAEKFFLTNPRLRVILRMHEGGEVNSQRGAYAAVYAPRAFFCARLYRQQMRIFYAIDRKYGVLHNCGYPPTIDRIFFFASQKTCY